MSKKIVSNISELRDAVVPILYDCFGKDVAVGEIWYDRAGNECSYRENGTLRVTTVNNDPSETIQSEKDNCDINLILEKFGKTGLMTNIRTDQPMYGDFSDLVDYQHNLIRVQHAQESFDALPAPLRARFNNDPGQLIDFLRNDDNRAEAIELGLVAPPQSHNKVQGDATAPSKGEGTPPPEGA